MSGFNKYDWSHNEPLDYTKYNVHITWEAVRLWDNKLCEYVHETFWFDHEPTTLEILNTSKAYINQNFRKGGWKDIRITGYTIMPPTKAVNWEIELE